MKNEDINRRIPEIIRAPKTTFHAKQNHVVAIFHIGGSTIGVRFESPEEIMNFFVSVMEKAAITWPNHPIVKEYQSD